MTDFSNVISIPVPGSSRFEQDVAMNFARLRAALGAEGTPTFDSTTVSNLTIDSLAGVLKATAGVVSGSASHSDLGGVTANQHHNQAHVLTGADHTVSGLTPGDVLTATGATTFAWMTPEAAATIEDCGTTEPFGKADGYIGVAVIGGEARIYFAVEGSMYYVAGTIQEALETGNPIGLLLSLTYTLE